MNAKKAAGSVANSRQSAAAGDEAPAEAMAPPYDPAVLRGLVEQSAGSLELAFRPMFGGIMGYVAGRPFVSLSDCGIALKLGGQDQERLIALGGAALRYAPDAPPSRSYMLVPASMLSVSEALAGWIARSAAHVAAAPAKPPRRKTR